MRAKTSSYVPSCLTRVGCERRRSVLGSLRTDVDAVQAVIQTPLRVLKALEAAGKINVEIWYDYVCIPQWQRQVQQRLISAMLLIFQQADITIIHLYDTSDDFIPAINKNPQSLSDDRLEAVGCSIVSSLCLVQENVDERGIHALSIDLDSFFAVYLIHDHKSSVPTLFR